MDSRAFLQAFMVICIMNLTAGGKGHLTKEAKESHTVAVRDVNVEVAYEPVGCFRDKWKHRALETLIKNYRGTPVLWANWPNMAEVIQGCAEEAFNEGYTVFGVQFYGECRSGKNGQVNYDRHGKSKNGCINGVGKKLANFVYRVLVAPIAQKAPYSVCNVGGQTYTDGDSMEVYKGDLVSGECDQCTCKNGELEDCHHIFHCVLNDSSCNSYSKKEGQCCPSCDRDVPDNAPVCRMDGNLYKEGESMELLKDLGRGLGNTSECHQCTCQEGKLQNCHRIYYCRTNELDCNPIKVPGQCCPTCARVIPKPPPPSCKVDGRNYKDGESMEVLKMSEDRKSGSCDQCLCNGGKLENCNHLFHCSLNNPNCTSYKKIHGQCCPECVLAQSNQNALGCKIHGQFYKHGESAEVLRESADKTIIYCEQCKCQAGSHSCHKIYDCDIQKWACEKSLKIPGQCCPAVCACYNNGTRLETGDKWQKLSGSDCIECTCLDNGTASCRRVEGGCSSV